MTKPAPQKTKASTSGNRTKFLSKDEEAELIRAWLENGDQAARSKVVEAHRPLVIRMAKRVSASGAEMEDLIQEGMHALLVALDKFDPTNGARFSTYATWHVLSHTQIFSRWAVNPVRIGQSRAEKKAYRLITAAQQVLAVAISEIPEEVIELIAEECETSVEIVHSLTHALNSRGVSLNNSVGVEGGTLQAIDLLVDEDAISAEDVDLTRQHRNLLEQALRNLEDGRAAYIIRRRQLSEEDVCLSELGEELGVSSERVRQLEKQGFMEVRRYLEEAGLSPKELLYAA